jgi:putative nucleotidyltransferase with HDIG domain
MDVTLEKAAATDKNILGIITGALLAFFTAAIAEIVLFNFSDTATLVGSVGRVSAIFILLYVLHRYARASLRSYRPAMKDLAVMGIVMVAAIVMVSIGRVISIGLISYLSQLKPNTLRDIASLLDPRSLYFAIPYAAPGILVQSVLGLQCGFLFGVSFALLIGIYSSEEPMVPLLVLATTLIGCFSMVRFRSRSAYLKAGMYVTLVSLPLALGSGFLDGDAELIDIVVRVFGAFLSGLLCTLLFGGLAPILEYLGGYATDMTLLEMATLDHPLLKDLSIQAPGTWNHSMVMGMMTESAAEVVGANPIVCRVGAYFHDIGKVKNPLYFVENQGRAENRHDKLSPSMSALIIRSHVKDGVKLAHQYKVPKIIEDMIPQHHGTALIEYFYDKACKEAEEAGTGTVIDPSSYSYPGPKPQTKEAGILMLADGIEAATRTLSEPTLDRIQGLVQKMINKVFASGELDECELTLKDLHKIAKCFTRVLNGIYHQRIAYNDPAEKIHERVEENPTAETSGQNTNVPEKTTDKEDLKRLGL